MSYSYVVCLMSNLWPGCHIVTHRVSDVACTEVKLVKKCIFACKSWPANYNQLVKMAVLERKLDDPGLDYLSICLYFVAWLLFHVFFRFSLAVYSLTLLFNMLCALALLCVGGANGGETFGVSLVYLVIFIPCSFVFWYQPLYKAFK